jgi:hypothetical protein
MQIGLSVLELANLITYIHNTHTYIYIHPHTHSFIFIVYQVGVCMREREREILNVVRGFSTLWNDVYKLYVCVCMYVCVCCMLNLL